MDRYQVCNSDENFSVYVSRIFYGKRDIPSHIKKER